MDYREFKNEVQKVDKSRIHKVTGSLGVYDAFKYIRKNKWKTFGIPRPLKEGEFYSIIREINMYLAEELSKGKDVKLPHRLGTLEIRKRPTRVEIVDGKLVTSLPIDWDKTLRLWYEDEEAFNNKTLVRVETNEVFKVYYNKKDANYNNKSFKVEITDQNLLQKSGGIVCGMSGAPIIQNNKLIGALTNVLVAEPKIGYGVFADIMIKEMVK